MLNFNQFINESKDHEFDSIDAGDTVQWAGSTRKVTKVGNSIIHIGTTKVNKGQWKQRDGKIIEKAKKEDDK
jgi:hypothetical protein